MRRLIFFPAGISRGERYEASPSTAVGISRGEHYEASPSTAVGVLQRGSFRGSLYRSQGSSRFPFQGESALRAGVARARLA